MCVCVWVRVYSFISAFLTKQSLNENIKITRQIHMRRILQQILKCKNADGIYTKMS